MSRLLFIAHKASRSGAVLQLHDMLRWLGQHSTHKITTVLLEDGDLANEFEKVGRTVKAYSGSGPSIPSRVLRRLVGLQPKSALHLALRQLQREAPFDLLYGNSVASGMALEVLHPVARCCIAHIHEMPTFIAGLDPRLITSVRKRADRIIVPSLPVAQGLADEHGCQLERITVVHGFVSKPQSPQVMGSDAREEIRAAAGIPPESWVLGVCGSASDVKGTDLLPMLAAALPDAVAGRPVHVVHVGRFGSRRDQLFIERDARLLGVQHKLHLLGPTADPAALMVGFDVHLLPSREDSCPLVVLEAASMGIPTICFTSGGGAANFCAKGAGVAVPYLSIEGMTSAAVRLLQDTALRTSIGAAAHERWRTAHQTDGTLPSWLRLMENEIAAARRSA